MNLNAIWSGNDYAYYPHYKPQGTKYVEHSRRVRAVRTFKQIQYGNSKATGFVEVLMVDEDGELVNDLGQTREVRARDILSTWEDHIDEKERRLVNRQREEVERQNRHAREATERAERLHQERQKESQFLELVDELNISRLDVSYSTHRCSIKTDVLTGVLNDLREAYKGAHTRNGQSVTQQVKESF